MHILVRRDQFNITPDGILHKPTDACFVPNRTRDEPGYFGEAGAPRATADAYDADEVEKVMLHLWAEYIESTGVQPEHDGKLMNGDAGRCELRGPSQSGQSIVNSSVEDEPRKARIT